MPKLKFVHNYKKNVSSSFSSQGYSLLEVIVSLSIFSVLSLSLIGGLIQIKNLSATSESETLMNNQLYNLIQNIQQNPNLHQKHYESITVRPQDVLLPTSAWYSRSLAEASDEDAQTKMQYMIVPEAGDKKDGLYGVHIFLTDKTLGKESSRKYYFLIREK